MLARCLAAAMVSCTVAGSAHAGDRELLAALDGGLGPTRTAALAAATGAPSRVQTHYDRARDLQERVRAAGPFSRSCHALGGWAARYASAEVSSAEGFDRLQPARARHFQQVARSARGRLEAARRACRPGTAMRPTVSPPLLEPRPGAVTFGPIVARAPAGADAATLIVNGAAAGPLVIAGGIARARLTGAAGRYTLGVRFTRAGTVIGEARSAAVWLLPPSAGGAVREADVDATWQAQIRAAADRFDGISGVWMHDLATGRSGSWNAGARFPAASTVKLGVLVEALRRSGPQPDRSALFHDALAIATWSSNLGANRLLRRVGGASGVQAALGRMGATSSTYTGPYIVATERPPVDAPEPPPRVSGRVTTAADLGVLMRVIHEAAAGERGALSRTGMTVAQARLALGSLLASEAAGDNLGLFRGAIGPSGLAAQKHGWISSARHSAAIVYAERGPVIIALTTYRRGLRRDAAAGLGAELVRIASAAP